MRAAIRVLIVDDQEILRRGLRMLLELEDDIEVVGGAEDGRRALALIPETDPDVVLVDARMPVLDGLGFTERCAQMHPGIRILVLTTFEDPGLVRPILDAGASGFLLKDVSTDGIGSAIRQVMDGGVVLDPRVARAALGLPREDRLDGHADSDLTETERAVAALVAKGSTNAQIADRLHLARGTVKNVVSALLRKLDVPDRTALAIRLLDRLG